jgi:hypothetical protein
MQVNVRLHGLELAKARLAEVNKKVDPVLRGALNTTATKARGERYVKPLGKTLKGARVRAAMKVKRANSRRLNSRIIPSSSGVLLMNYRAWGFDPINPTRARLWVRAPNGRKVAAGFVNPSSAGKLPWNTRGKKARAAGKKAFDHRRLAMGPSVAYWFKALTDAQTIRWINGYLQQEFEARIRKEIAKARI